MKRLIAIRLVVAAAGVAVWGYGQRYDEPNIRLAGMAFMAVAIVLRFVPKRNTSDEPHDAH